MSYLTEVYVQLINGFYPTTQCAGQNMHKCDRIPIKSSITRTVLDSTYF